MVVSAQKAIEVGGGVTKFCDTDFSDVDLESELWALWRQKEAAEADLKIANRSLEEARKEKDTFSIQSALVRLAEKKEHAQKKIDAAEEDLKSVTCRLSILEPKRLALQWCGLKWGKETTAIDLSNSCLLPVALQEIVNRLLEGEKDANSFVEWVSFNNNDFGDDGSAALAKLCKQSSRLQYLGLRNTGLTEKGLSALCGGLAISKCTLTVDLRRNRLIKNEEAKRSAVDAVGRFNKKVALLVD